jgi:hypothetical protein
VALNFPELVGGLYFSPVRVQCLITPYNFAEGPCRIQAIYYHEVFSSYITTVKFGGRRAARGNYFGCANRINVYIRAVSRSLCYQTASDA